MKAAAMVNVAALPEDGSPISLPDLAHGFGLRTLQLSNQVERMARAGLIAIDRTGRGYRGGARMVRRNGRTVESLLADNARLRSVLEQIHALTTHALGSIR